MFNELIEQLRTDLQSKPDFRTLIDISSLESYYVSFNYNKEKFLMCIPHRNYGKYKEFFNYDGVSIYISYFKNHYSIVLKDTSINGSDVLLICTISEVTLD